MSVVVPPETERVYSYHATLSLPKRRCADASRERERNGVVLVMKMYVRIANYKSNDEDYVND